jgi:hypothetical protein
MTTVQVVSKIDIDLNELLDGVAKLDTPELERFVYEVGGVLARRRAVSLPVREAELLRAVNQGTPPAVRRRVHDLSAKLEDETLSPDEHTELLGMVDLIEQADAERLASLIELAQLRGESLDALMDRLGIRPPTDAQTVRFR